LPQCSIFNSATALENETLQFLGNDHFAGQLLERFFPAPKDVVKKTIADLRGVAAFDNLGSEPPCGGAERTQYSRLFECRLSPLTFCRLAPAANVRTPPFM
jgi:hypothetical protein